MNDTTAALAEKVGAVLVPNPGAEPAIDILEWLRPLSSEGGRSWILRCSFDEGGPWAGVRDLFSSLVGSIRAEAPRLFEKHDYDLVHVLPELLGFLNIRNPTLTDTSANEERVRNYPADRAMRIVHGLIDLLIELWSQKSPDRVRVLVCADFDRASHMGRCFFRELMRRAGSQLRLVIVALPSEAGAELDVDPVLPCHPLSCLLRVEPGDLHRLDQDDARREAEAMEEDMGDDLLRNTAGLPRLIFLWQVCGRKDKVLRWKYEALRCFNTLGLYQDAIRYGEAAREIIKSMPEGPSRGNLCWGIFFKLFMCYVATGAAQAAYRLAEEDVLEDRGDPAEAPMRIRLCYLMAMLHARIFSPRDFLAGESYLDQGLEYMDKSTLADDERCFHFVFNRNGLAMIRSFQGRFEEALDLCREGIELLEKNLSPDQHRLHRSVLLYNIAQVYAQTGEPGEAIRFYSAAMKMDPNYSEYYNERGNLFLKLGRLEEAELDYRQAIELSPPYFEVWSNLGHCYRLLGRMEEALAAYSRSLDLQPDQATAYLGRSQALEALGRLSEAIEGYSTTLALDTACWQAHAARAVLFYEDGNRVDSLADLDSAISLAPDEADLYQNRSAALSSLGRNQEARRDLMRYLELRPDASDRAEIEVLLGSWEMPQNFHGVNAGL
ncbi:MAG: hypothetical protein QOH06_5616 [Acidobacteriota bacterium]|jgi:tetratricopeptide (TPR) repeat protein|nr:hypothetical protein [Acidobacteriota bacterium]